MAVRRGFVATKELEHFFKKYPEVPKNCIIKEDVCRQGLACSDAALEITKNYQTKEYYLFQMSKTKIEETAQRESLYAPEEIQVYGGPYQIPPTVIYDRIDRDSPYILDVIDGKLMLCDRSEESVVRPLAEVRLRKAPKWYKKTLPDGKPYSTVIASSAWGWVGFLTALQGCQYWGNDEECKFCDINAHVKKLKVVGRPFIAHKKIEDVVKVAEAVWEDCPRDGSVPESTDLYPTPGELFPHTLQITGGTVIKEVGGLNDADFYFQYIGPIKEKMPGRLLYVYQGAPQPKEVCKKFKEAGVDVWVNNYEVWDRNLFKIICPGKERFIGYDNWIKWTCDAVDVFGEGNVHPGFVAGVSMAQPWGFKTVDEAVRSEAKSFEFLMSHGVIPRPINWCAEPGSALAGHPLVPLEYWVRMLKAWHETWIKYQLPNVVSFGHFGPGRGKYALGAYVDMPLS